MRPSQKNCGILCLSLGMILANACGLGTDDVASYEQEIKLPPSLIISPDACGENAKLYPGLEGAYCRCNDGYEGNPYQGCTEIDNTDPCEDVQCGANAYCVSGTCRCAAGYQGDPQKGCSEVPCAGGAERVNGKCTCPFGSWSHDPARYSCQESRPQGDPASSTFYVRPRFDKNDTRRICLPTGGLTLPGYALLPKREGGLIGAAGGSGTTTCNTVSTTVPLNDGIKRELRIKGDHSLRIYVNGQESILHEGNQGKNYCGPAAAQAVLRVFKHDLQQSYLADRMNTNDWLLGAVLPEPLSGWGTLPKDLARVLAEELDNKTKGVYSVRRSEGATVLELKTALLRGYPVIVLVSTIDEYFGSNKQLHWTVVTGFNHTGVYVSQTRRTYHVPFSAFIKMWEFGNLNWVEKTAVDTVVGKRTLITIAHKDVGLPGTAPLRYCGDKHELRFYDPYYSCSKLMFEKNSKGTGGSHKLIFDAYPTTPSDPSQYCFKCAAYGRGSAMIDGERQRTFAHHNRYLEAKLTRAAVSQDLLCEWIVDGRPQGKHFCEVKNYYFTSAGGSTIDFIIHPTINAPVERVRWQRR
jgi:hypothetical protein